MASGTKGLQVWCKKITQNYGSDVEIKNMTTSWKNGLAFCAILHYYRPDLIDFNSLSKENVFENNEKAFRIAEDELGIPALLDAEDMVALKVPDRLSILTYVSQYYNYFKDKVPGKIEAHRIPSKKRHASKSGENSDTVAKRALKETAEHEKFVKKGTANLCCVCGKSVYLMERFTAEGKLFHRVCVKCSICDVQLKNSTYEYDSKTEKFYCEKHYKQQDEVLNKRDDPEGQELSPSKGSLQNIPEDTVMGNDTGHSSEEDPLTPFRRNEPFVRKGIRPQSSPADMNWEKVNVIKSKEEDRSTPSKSKEGAKSFLSNVINKKSNKDVVQQTDFPNPAYQQHLELSKFMNKINKDESWEESDRIVIGSENQPMEDEQAIERVRTLSKVKLTNNTLSNQEIFEISEKEVIHQDNNQNKKKKLVLRKKKKKKDEDKDHENDSSVQDNIELNSKDIPSENYENLEYASAYLSAANSQDDITKKHDYENINDLPVSSSREKIHASDILGNDKKLEVSAKNKYNEIKAVTDSRINLRKNNKKITPRAESCIDLSTPETRYLEIKSNLKKVKSHNNIVEDVDKENTLEEFHKMKSKLKKTGYKVDEFTEQNKDAENISKEKKRDNKEEAVSFESHLCKDSNQKKDVKQSIIDNQQKNNLRHVEKVDKPLPQTPMKEPVSKQDSGNPFLSSESSPEILRKNENSKLDNTNPFLTSTEDLLFDTDNEFDDSNPFAEDARIERRDTLQKSQSKPIVQQRFAAANPFLESSSEEENEESSIVEGKKPTTPANKPKPRPRSKKREAPKRPDRPPQFNTNSPKVDSKTPSISLGSPQLNPKTGMDLKRRNSGKKRQAPRPPQKLIDENNINKEKSNVSNGEVILLSKKAMPHDYCSIDSLARQTVTQVINNNTTENSNDSSQNEPIRKPEKRQAPRRPVSAQLSYDEATILQSVALRDKQPKRDEIEQELKFLEVRQRELEMEGVVMEKKLRESMRGEPEEPYLIAWFDLVNQKNQLLRRENELIYMCQEMDFLKSQRRAEFELRKLMAKPEKLRSPKDKKREEELLQQILEFVTKRSHIVDRMDEDRLREYEEDQEIMMMMDNQGLTSPSVETSTPEKHDSKEKKNKNRKEKKKREKGSLKK